MSLVKCTQYSLLGQYYNSLGISESAAEFRPAEGFEQFHSYGGAKSLRQVKSCLIKISQFDC